MCFTIEIDLITNNKNKKIYEKCNSLLRSLSRITEDALRRLKYKQIKKFFILNIQKKKNKKGNKQRLCSIKYKKNFNIKR